MFCQRFDIIAYDNDKSFPSYSVEEAPNLDQGDGEGLVISLWPPALGGCWLFDDYFLDPIPVEIPGRYRCSHAIELADQILAGTTCLFTQNIQYLPPSLF